MNATNGVSFSFLRLRYDYLFSVRGVSRPRCLNDGTINSHRKIGFFFVVKPTSKVSSFATLPNEVRSDTSLAITNVRTVIFLSHCRGDV